MLRHGGIMPVPGGETCQVPRGTQTTLDDWFPEKCLNKPVGWEVEPGPAFSADDVFDDYLESFMRLHDERQKNDGRLLPTLDRLRRCQHGWFAAP